jgi:DNA-binding MarR family transcriptional regulator
LENKRLFGLICCLQRTLSRVNQVNLSEYGISGAGMHALIFLHKSEKLNTPVCQRDIEHEVGLRPSSVSSMIANLEKEGLISRSQAEGDARTKYLTLTEKGVELCNKNKQLMDHCDEIVEEALSEEEQEELKYLLTKVLEKNKE